MWTSSGLRVWIVWAIKLGKDGYVYGGFGLKKLSTQMEEGESYLPAEDGHQGVPFIGQAGRPGPTGLGGCMPLLGSVFFSAMISPLWPLYPRAPLVAPPKRSRSLLCLHYGSFHLMLLALSHVHAPLLHLLHMPPCISCKVMLAAHPCLSYACGLDESCSKGIQWCIMVHAWLTLTRLSPSMYV
jgi:hypothetical protein